MGAAKQRFQKDYSVRTVSPNIRPPAKLPKWQSAAECCLRKTDLVRSVWSGFHSAVPCWLTLNCRDIAQVCIAACLQYQVVVGRPAKNAPVVRSAADNCGSSVYHSFETV